MLTTPFDRPVIIGIVGDSGAGKSTLAAGIAQALGRQRSVCICIDDYHRYPRQERAKIGMTPHDPACNYMDILEQHVALLRDGQPILKPVYNHNGGVLEAPEYVAPKPFIILEGLLGYATPTLRDVYDVKFYLEPEEGLRLRWKHQRDTTMGAYTEEQLRASMAKLATDSEHHVLPQRKFADMIVKFYPPDEMPEATGSSLNVAHILRPTLPYMDLAPLLEAGHERGFLLELARDVDGRPVDALHIFGNMGDDSALAMEDYLWDLIPDAPQEHAEIGIYHDADRRICRSHTLSLSQLVITHYLLHAALAQQVN